MRTLVTLSLIVSLLSVSFIAFAESPGWRRAKNAADVVIYAGKDRTLYCGCVFTSDGDNDGSGSVDHQACDYVAPQFLSHHGKAKGKSGYSIIPSSKTLSFMV